MFLGVLASLTTHMDSTVIVQTHLAIFLKPFHLVFLVDFCNASMMLHGLLIVVLMQLFIYTIILGFKNCCT